MGQIYPYAIRFPVIVLAAHTSEIAVSILKRKQYELQQ
jgi:hypothetical protein